MASFPSFLGLWNYRKRIRISGSSGAGTNYQVLLKIGENYTTWQPSTAYSAGALVKPTAGSNSFFYECTTAGTSGTTEPTWPTTDGATVTNGTVVWTARAGFTLDGKSAKFPSGTNDSGDIRFVDADSLNLQSFWVEKVTGTSPNRVAYVWVKVSADLGSDQYLYCFFGNPNASNASNGKDTFLFFDDFENYVDGSDINGQGGWVTNRVGGTGEAKVRITNGRKHLHLSSTDQETIVVRPHTISNYGVAFRICEYGVNVNEVMGQHFTDETLVFGYSCRWWEGGGIYSRLRRYTSGSDMALTFISDTDTVNVYRTLEFAWFGSSLKGFRDGLLKLSAIDSTFSLLTYIHLRVYSPSDRYIDWVVLRRYIYPEPSFSLADELEERSSILITLNGWGYRKSFAIAEQSGNSLTDYSVCLRIGESSTSTNYNFHLGGLSAKFPSGKNDSGDLRFYDGTNGLSFWVEKVSGTAPNRTAYVWIKIPYLSASQVKTLWCYFGNPNATNVSNGDNTFILFDDFDMTSLNTIKWTPVGDYSISNSVIQINPNHTNNPRTVDGISCNDGIYSNLTFNYPIEIKTRVTGHTDYVSYGLGLLGLSYKYNDGGASYWGLYFNNSRIVTWGYDVPPNGLVGDVLVRITYDSFYLMDPSVYTPRTWNYGLHNNPNNYRIVISSWYPSDISIDFITVRKYIFPEPSLAWSGKIEKNSIPSSYFIVSYKQKN